MKTKVPIIAIISFVILAGKALALDAQIVSGQYELVGVMEMAGGLNLMEKRQYVAGFSYGAADWQEEGTWKIEGEEVVLEGARLKVNNSLIPSPFVPSGTRFRYHEGKLTGTDPSRKLNFLNPNKTPSPKRKTADSAGEGRMRVRGTVVQLDAEVLVVKMEECIQFDVKGLSDSVLKTAKQRLGKNIDVEIPYSSILAGGSCP